MSIGRTMRGRCNRYYSIVCKKSGGWRKASNETDEGPPITKWNHIYNALNPPSFRTPLFSIHPSHQSPTHQLLIFTHPIATTSWLPASLGPSNRRPMHSVVNSMNGTTVLVRALPQVEEPIHGEGFAMVLSGKVEVLASVVGKNDEDGNDFTGVQGHEDVPKCCHSNTQEQLHSTNPTRIPFLLCSSNGWVRVPTSGTSTPIRYSNSRLNMESTLLPKAHPSLLCLLMVLPPPVCSTMQRPVPPQLASILANSCWMLQCHLIALNPPANIKDNY